MKENDIAESLRRMAVQWQSMAEAADAFDSMGSIKQSTDSANQMRDAAMADAQKAKDEAVTITAQTKDLQVQADAILSNAQGKAANLISVAQLSADMIAKDAAALMASAAANASNDAAALIALTKSNLSTVQDQITQNLAIKDGLEKDLVQLQVEIKDATASLEATRNSMKALVAGL